MKRRFSDTRAIVFMITETLRETEKEKCRNVHHGCSRCSCELDNQVARQKCQCPRAA
ncbi:hypothetical protein PUN28_019237 [Cardiocondyla obscurior]|uniref:Uncharacterized protein n=1 Tax=Cardiocondyla obscurior TaxID=286306 RepID=A0AAW2EEF6_9HYME